jgi:hypothetical protein
MSKLPDFDVFTVTGADDSLDDKKGFWTKLGGAWRHSDGKGLNIELQGLPLDGKLVLRKHKPKEA